MAFATPILWPGLYVGTVPLASAGVQLAAERLPASTSRDMRFNDSDQDLDEFPSSPHRQLIPGQNRGTSVTGSPNGYDAKHLNRLWGRFHGAKSNSKGEKTHKSSGPDVESRPTRWAR
jgi:hypothetical protein